jgi:hypothetical protein
MAEAKPPPSSHRRRRCETFVVESCRCCGQVAGATRVIDVASTDTGERFTIARCDACAVLQTRPVPDDLAPYYGTDLARTMKAPESGIFAALRRVQLGREAARITRNGDPGPVVDVGCGSGDFILSLHRRGLRCIAADAGEEAPPALQASPEVRYVRFDFDTYELATGDLPEGFTVVLRHVLEHVRDPQVCLERLERRGARRFYIVVPNAASRECRLLGSHWYLWDAPRHLWHFEPETLAAVCSRAGLAIVDRGLGTTAALAPSVYRSLRLRGWPASLYAPFGPTSLLTALSAPLNLLLPGNVAWVVAQASA